MKLLKFSLLVTFLLMSMSVFAQVAAELPVTDFLAQVIEAIKSFGGLAWGMKVAAVITLIISSMKVSFIRQYTWDKVHGSLKALIAPALGLIAGLLSMGKFDGASLVAWAFAGAGAVLLNSVLDGVKQLPGVGPQYVALINFIEMILMKPKA